MVQQFSNVVRELDKWFQTFKWYHLLRSIELPLLLAGLGLVFFRKFLILILPWRGDMVVNDFFYTFPLQSLAYHGFLLGAWLTLTSRNVKYLPYALWGYAFYILFPFTNISLSGLISAAVYALLGYGVFRYSVSSYAIEK